MPIVVLRTQPVELYKLLKFEGLAASGGEAKALIAQGQVKLNGDVETRKRKKIVAGDVVEFDNESYVVSLQSDARENSVDKDRANIDGADDTHTNEDNGSKDGSAINAIDTNTDR